MGSQIWSDVNSLYYSCGLYLFFFFSQNSCFTSEKFLGITASKFEFYCMKYLIFFFFETTEH